MTVEHQGNVTFTGGENIGTYASSSFAQRGFCRRCGSSLFWKRNDSPSFWLSAGALDDVTDLKFGEEYHIADRPQYYALVSDGGKITHG